MQAICNYCNSYFHRVRAHWRARARMFYERAFPKLKVSIVRRFIQGGWKVVGAIMIRFVVKHTCDCLLAVRSVLLLPAMEVVWAPWRVASTALELETQDNIDILSIDIRGKYQFGISTRNHTLTLILYVNHTLR